MNVFLEPLPGLLDDPQFQIPDLPHLTDYHIAPLRDPAPSRSLYAPLPLEPTAGSNVHSRTRTTSAKAEAPGKRKTPKISPAEVLLARDAKKPSLAISELIEAQKDETPPVQLPSFISLAIVERSPVQQAQSIDGVRPPKRPRLDLDVDTNMNEEYRHLPLPSQKDGQNAGRTKPLLPAMVTGLHEPPPTAALLPSMETEKLLNRSPRKSPRPKNELLSKVIEKRGQGRPPEQMLNSPEITAMPLAPLGNQAVELGERQCKDIGPAETKNMENKPKARRKPKWWTDEETEQLMQGVRKHGIGKWKQILTDPDFQFDGRSCVDLKDRFRVRMPDAYRDRELVVEQMTPPKHSSESDGARDSSQGTPSLSTVVSTSRAPSKGSPKEIALPTTEIALRASDTSPSPIISQGGLGPSQAPASKTLRRKRRPWTTTEDNDLMRGVQRHGFQWTLIHDDPTLNLSHRRATDLRDRIRNMFPDGYKNAGTRPKKDQSDGMRTLPPLVLGDDDGDWDWSNNTLPPLLEWEEIGM